MIQVKKMDDNAIIPTMGTPGAAGWDLYSLDHKIVPGYDWQTVETGIAVSIPPDCVGYIKPRSGWAIKYGIGVLGGVIDSDYRGEIKVILINHWHELFQVNEGDRIAQLVVQPIHISQMMVVEELGETLRGEGGFGSTGA